MKPSIVFTGGGTAGHVYPGLAVIERLPPDLRSATLWIGSRAALERPIVEAAGVPYVAIPGGKLRRYVSLKNLIDVVKILGGLIVALRLLRRLRPRVLFSKGGYVAVPPVWAARLLGIPVLIHESDVDPGLATRLTMRQADAVFVAYERTRSALPAGIRDRVFVVGNPVRRAILAGEQSRGYRWCALDPVLPLVFVQGGSQGSQQINRLVRRCLPELLRDMVIVHQTGDPDWQVPEAPGSRYCHAPFFGDIYPDLLAACVVSVSRAGAGSIWEAAVAGKPMVLIPLRSGSRGDQERNAAVFAAAGAAIVFDPDAAGSGESQPLAVLIRQLVAAEHQRAAMTEACGRLVRTDAARLIAERIAAYVRTDDAAKRVPHS